MPDPGAQYCRAPPGATVDPSVLQRREEDGKAWKELGILDQPPHRFGVPTAVLYKQLDKTKSANTDTNAGVWSQQRPSHRAWLPPPLCLQHPMSPKVPPHKLGLLRKLYALAYFTFCVLPKSEQRAIRRCETTAASRCWELQAEENDRRQTHNAQQYIFHRRAILGGVIHTCSR